MSKFIITTCLLLFWAFYEMSGGADFVPLERKPVVAKAPVADLPEPPINVVPVRAVDPVADVIRATYVRELVIEPAPENVAPAVIETSAADQTLPVREVAGDWVNMRDGPSTAFSVLDTLPRGTRAEILDVNADGWAQIRLIEGGQTGWMAERLLSEG